MKPKAMLATYFAGSLLLSVSSVMLVIQYLPTDETMMKYFFGLLAVFWGILAAFFGLDLFKGDVILIQAWVLRIKNNRVWLQWETGRKSSVFLTDPALLKSLAPNKQVELMLSKRTKQFVALRPKP